MQTVFKNGELLIDDKFSNIQSKVLNYSNLLKKWCLFIRTASNYITDDYYFGRNFDHEIPYNERVTITPRNYKFKFRKIDGIDSHYAIIGIAAVLIHILYIMMLVMKKD